MSHWPYELILFIDTPEEKISPVSGEAGDAWRSLPNYESREVRARRDLFVSAHDDADSALRMFVSIERNRGK